MQVINIRAQRCIAVFTGCLARSADLAQQVQHEIAASCRGGIDPRAQGSRWPSPYCRFFRPAIEPGRRSLLASFIPKVLEAASGRPLYSLSDVALLLNAVRGSPVNISYLASCPNEPKGSVQQ